MRGTKRIGARGEEYQRERGSYGVGMSVSSMFFAFYDEKIW